MSHQEQNHGDAARKEAFQRVDRETQLLQALIEARINIAVFHGKNSVADDYYEFSTVAVVRVANYLVNQGYKVYRNPDRDRWLGVEGWEVMVDSNICLAEMLPKK